MGKIYNPVVPIITEEMVDELRRRVRVGQRIPIVLEVKKSGRQKPDEFFEKRVLWLPVTRKFPYIVEVKRNGPLKTATISYTHLLVLLNRLREGGDVRWSL